MDEEELVTPAAEENEEEIELDFEENNDEEEDTVESLRQKLDDERKAREKAEEIANDRKIRAEKAESKVKTQAPAAAPSKQNDVTTRDMYALMQANVPLEDVDQVVDYAKFKKITVAEALANNVVKTMLSDAQETRKTASVANTGATRRGAQSKTPELIYEKAQKGELPETDSEFDALAAARINSGATSRRRA